MQCAPPRRPGRKRKSGRRNTKAKGRNAGRLIDWKVPTVDRAAIAAHQPHRRDLPPHQQLDTRAETVLGHLAITGHITPHQYEAGIRYRTDVLMWRAAIGSPKLALPSMGVQHSSSDLNDQEFQRRRDAYDRITAALAPLDPLAHIVLAAVVIWDAKLSSSESLAVLRDALQALAVAFGIARSREAVLPPVFPSSQ